MERLLSVLIVLAIIGTGGYFYLTANAVCKVPLHYRVGTLDPEFGLTKDEARSAISDAESLWEDATERNLFTYDENASFTINFLYDNRQEETKIEHSLEEELAERKDLSDEVKEDYEHLLDEYDDLKDAYEERLRNYERTLTMHNAEVEEWNQKGGAPAETYKVLESREKGLAEEQEDLNRLASELNRMVGEINNLGERGNTIVSAYNNVVERYNDRFHEDQGEEFTQGDYQGDRVHIYQYDDMDELRVVLAHELGHAISLDHVEGDRSIMYYLMGAQRLEEGLSQEDVAEFRAICGSGETKWQFPRILPW